jgi:hypothetical protein
MSIGEGAGTRTCLRTTRGLAAHISGARRGPSGLLNDPQRATQFPRRDTNYPWISANSHKGDPESPVTSIGYRPMD